MEDIQIIKGISFPRYFTKNIEDALEYLPQDEDIIIASYPKTGTTWLQYIVLQIVSRSESFPTFNDVLHKVAPFMEMVGVKTVEELKEPRIYKQHIPYNMVKKNPKAKYIYIYRKPEDTFISYFHFMNETRPGNPYDIDQYLEGFLSGNIWYGRYFEHVLSYWEYRDDENVLLVSYEELCLNRKKEILRIAKFLGEGYYQDILTDESVLEKILEHTSFEYMKRNLYVSGPNNHEHKECSEGNEGKINFFRKGKIGDGKQSMSKDQLKRLRVVMERVMKGTTLLDEWLKD